MTIPAAPCLYEVRIGHSRRAPVAHRFRYRACMWLVDADAPPRLAWPWRLLAGFPARDHLDIRSRLGGQGIYPERILMLAGARTLGYVFNPLSVYWCYDAGGRLEARVAEVHNTYGERHAYVIPVDEEMPAAKDHRVDKAMYVSPFYPVDGAYRLRVGDPAETLAVEVTLERPGDEPFHAWMRGRRLAASRRRLLTTTVRYGLGPWRVRALIQWQGMRLWQKGLEVQPR